ncbi:carnosine synthase 1-like [Acipenser oxyrinchus oxyrinchus]|uniref:Carnosine synthase 1-like n=1 Tax=Acipenser oxyrinchus oxyrinchus TaxID=40147 RepID=A0AAD8CFX9_ACIOX|nr:carnosine synthase 1-like [Acipenser oxyrinchus oxyrinchus]
MSGVKQLSLDPHPCEFSPFGNGSPHPLIIPQLDPQEGVRETERGRERVGQLYKLLQNTLHEAGLPETRDRTREPATVSSNSDITICVLGSPLPYLSLLLEGGREAPGDVFLCLSPSWLSRSPSPLHRASPPCSSTGRLLRAGGCTYLEDFRPPRRITYLLPVGREEGQEVTREADCPMGSSPRLAELLGDTLLTRVLLERNRVRCPPTLGLMYRPPRSYQTKGTTVTAVSLTEREGQGELVQREVLKFLESLAMEPYSKVVLKPSGGRWSGSHRPVRFLAKRDCEAVCREVCSMLPLLEEGETVLLEAFCPTMSPVSPVLTQTWDMYRCVNVPRPDLSFRMCAVVTRSPEGLPLLNQLVCSVGRSDSPIRHGSSPLQSLETTLQDWGLSDPAQCSNIHSQVKSTAETCLRVAMEMEAGLSPEQRGGWAAQTDMIGVDMLLSCSGQVVTPFCLGLKPSRCLESCGLFLSRGGALLHTPLNRSQRYIMEGRNLLIIGAGGFSKTFVWESARDFGLKIHLVESNPTHFAAGLVTTFIHLDLTDHKQAPENCSRICEALCERGIHPDGCLTFWDDCVVLVALVCERLGLRSSPTLAVRTARQKSQTHLRLLDGAPVEPSLADFRPPSSLEPKTTSSPPRPRLPLSSPEPTPGCCYSSPRLSSLIRSVEPSNGSTTTTTIADFSPASPSNNTISDIADNRVNLTKLSGNPIRDPLSEKATPVDRISGLFPDSPLPLPLPSCPVWTPSPHIYAVPCYHLESRADVEKAAWLVSFPAVMKLEYGAGAVGSKCVNSAEECQAHFEKISNDIREGTDYAGAGLAWSNAMTLMEYLSGTEHDIDLVLFNGQKVAAFISDNGPTRVPSFTVTAAAMPSYLRPDKRAQLVEAALRCCLGCGLTDGVFNVEMKMTPTGPRLIEINARMGGYYLRDWIRVVYGADILLAAFMVACGLRPRIPEASPPLCHLIGVMCILPQHFRVLKTTASSEVLRLLHSRGVIRFSQLVDELILRVYENAYCNVACQSQDRDAARLQLLSACQILGIDSPDYPVSYFLSDFK